MVAEKQGCALCGLEIAGAGVRQSFGGQERVFCCQGCARVYQLGLESGTLEAVLAQNQGKGPAASTQGNQIARFSVQGMHCASCRKLVVRTLLRQPGILEVEVDLSTGQGQMRYDPTRANVSEALRAVDGLGMGYRAELV